MTLTTAIAAFTMLALLFGFVVLFGAPYLPTLRRQTKDALDMLDLERGDTLLELGSGDGRFMLAAAKRGIHCVGYELNPLLVLYSRIRCWRYRRLVTVKWANFWRVEWPDANGIYVFLLQRYMERLDAKITEQCRAGRSCKLVSFAFTIPNREPIEQTNGLFLYEYYPQKPARHNAKKTR